ncbi:UDP-N-acetylglucosamine transferase subunit ALG13 homolog [Culicoides brevitarsis]|uniref:UDP-N-acetylglucosamine transferase subunit ALG13 homolog n=1 Tax=Culicoides brevitarsis TaxID=469753 RepID=UPI00307B4BD3
MPFSSIFVTVGTTQFNELIKTICTTEVREALKEIGCKTLTIQTGTGDVPTEITEIYANTEGITLKTYELKSTIAQDIKEADLVVSHAGAGSCIEVLRAGKPLLTVINDELADNHQVELAEELCRQGYLFFCTPKRLAQALRQFDATKLKKYEQGNVKEFVKYLDNFMGFDVKA